MSADGVISQPSSQFLGVLIDIGTDSDTPSPLFLLLVFSVFLCSFNIRVN